MTRPSLNRLQDSIGEATHAVQRRYASALNDAQHAAARGGALARATTADVSRQMRSTARQTRNAIAARPIEAVAIAAVAGIAIGWLVRYLSEPRRRSPQRPGRRRPPSASNDPDAPRRARATPPD
jgi:ElaB/YqjD/DUF883 family membrane-anchored ribosome-binding protein